LYHHLASGILSIVTNHERLNEAIYHLNNKFSLSYTCDENVPGRYFFHIGACMAMSAVQALGRVAVALQ
jgi:hypothetical protein